MRGGLLILAIAVASAVGACGGAQDVGEWGSGSGAGFCSAMRVGPSEVLSITLGEENAEGISIKAAPFDAAIADAPQQGLQLHVDGRPVRSIAVGVPFGGTDGGAGIHFPLNVRHLLRRHPGGFSLAVQRDGSEVYAAQVGESAKAALSEMQRCDQERRFRGRPGV